MNLRTGVISIVLCSGLVALAACVGDAPSQQGPDGSSDAAQEAGPDGTAGDGAITDASNDGTTKDADAEAPPHVPVVDAYVKSSNTRAGAFFGQSVALSADGNTMAVGSEAESSAATGVNNANPGQGDTSKPGAGAVYVFVRASGTWSQIAYIKASNPTANANFGYSVALSSDGSRMIVGARGEGTTQTGSGAVYFFTGSGTGVNQTWSQTGPMFKASNLMASMQFGFSVAMSGDGNSAAVSAIEESASSTGVTTGAGGVPNGSFAFAGSAYLFAYSGGNWSQTNYVKPSNTQAGGRFGWSVALSNDGAELAVGSEGEASAATGVGISSNDTSAPFAGATYIFSKASSLWSQTAYIKASNTRAQALFGKSVALGGVGGTALAVGSSGESSGATGVDNTNPGQGDTSANNSGAAYLFTRSGSTWSQVAYVKSSNTRGAAAFGTTVAVSLDGNTLAVGSTGENSAATDVNGTNPGQGDTSVANAGAVYVFTPVVGTWTQTAYVKSSFAHSDNFGISAAVTNKAATLAVGGATEPSNAKGINGDATNTLAAGSGAVFVFK